MVGVAALIPIKPIWNKRFREDLRVGRMKRVVSSIPLPAPAEASAGFADLLVLGFGERVPQSDAPFALRQVYGKAIQAKPNNYGCERRRRSRSGRQRLRF